MPNIDVSSYFFTAAVPVCNDGIVEHDGMKSSPIHVMREVLETLPTALQSHATEEIGLNSPFSRSLRTHFARLVVIDQPNFNGRDHSNALVNAIKGTDLLDPQPVDQLTCPYLLVMLDFDLPDPKGTGEPRRYFEELWGLMEPELRSIFQYCYGFDSVGDAAGFAAYMLKCQIETTMPFHDYWYLPPKLSSISVPLLAAIALAGPAIAILAGIGAWLGWTEPLSRGWTIALWAMLPVGLLIDYGWIMWKGNQPYPATPDANLRNVLKGLYLQQAFTRFAIEQQHRDPADWGKAFRAFLDANRPADLDGPTQPPGVIRSRLPGDAA
ncbi:hypothetical protein OF829_02230 [Sphingomonas sp. LB-2]|uniref:hypothetical protein n=1 Tax=Sphingomonas caeni TaxID=2984949 RepID=UPI0022313FC1|nr:hypothetical protein [Sphingomonas caeni]MCW3846039.1 hypothetical protein [Sphingomonas caeni]